jgi:hypothetical protein
MSMVSPEFPEFAPEFAQIHFPTHFGKPFFAIREFRAEFRGHHT